MPLPIFILDSTRRQSGKTAQPALNAWLSAAFIGMAVIAVQTATISTARAENAAAAKQAYSIPAGSLSSVLSQFAAEAGVMLSADAALAEGKTSKGLQGSYSVQEGFAALLANSELQASKSASGGYKIGRKVVAVEPAILPEVKVSAAPQETATSPLRGYVATRSATATKTDTSILEIPQSVTVIGRPEIEARGSQDIMDILAQTPGIAVNGYGPDNRGWEDITLRGFPGASSSFRDGLPQTPFGVIYRMTEPYGLERVEVLRGPSSVMFGQADAGGVINRVSKRPTGERIREVEVQYGNFQRKQLAFDLGDQVGGRDDLSYRVVGLGLDSNDQDKYPNGDKINRNRQYLAPSLRWQLAPATSVTLLSEFVRNNSGEDPYFAIAGDGSLSKVKMGDPSFSRFRQHQSSAGYLFEHAFNDSWMLRQNMRYTTISLDRRVVWVDELQPDLHTYTRQARTWDDQLRQTSLDTHLQGRLSTAATEHTLLVGLDVNHLTGDALRKRGTAPSLDLLNPIYDQAIPDPQNVSADFSQTTRQIGFYAQDQIKIKQRWVVTLGGRQDHVKSTTDDRLNEAKSRQNDSAFSGRAGLTYLAGNGWAPYISYAESFLPTSGLDSNGDPFKPSRGKQVEVGLKFQPQGSRSLFTAALFDLRKTNVAGYDPLADMMRQIGKQRARGLELEARTELAPGLNAIASYTLLDAKILQSADSSEVGKQPPVVPDRSASLWLDYTLANGLGIGSGLNYTGKRQNDEVNTNQEGGFTLLNAMVRYNYDAWQLRLNASNLLNKEYNTICYHGECYQGRERTLIATLKYRF